MLPSLLQHLQLDPNRINRVSGGDINQAFQVYRNDQPYFIKINQSGPYPGMMEKEARGLDTLRKNSLFIIPEVQAVGEWEGWQYLILEWLAPAAPQPDYWTRFAEALAHQHHQAQQQFGWEEDNYIGQLPQRNTPSDSWVNFYAEQRITPLVQQLVDKGALSTAALHQLTTWRRTLPERFPQEPPALLHGDLWSGNLLSAKKGHPALIDPAVYAGHREMDIGMTQLFGGFHHSFIDAYQYYYPLEKNWQERLPLTQLYPILVHAVLFGGHYITSARELLQK